MNRWEAVTRIAQLCVLLNNSVTIGVLLPSSVDARRFKCDVVDHLMEVPTWMFSGLAVNQADQIRTSRGVTVKFIHSVNQTRGWSFDMLYMSNNISEDDRTQYAFTVLPILGATGGSLITFDDE